MLGTRRSVGTVSGGVHLSSSKPRPRVGRFGGSAVSAIERRNAANAGPDVVLSLCGVDPVRISAVNQVIDGSASLRPSIMFRPLDSVFANDGEGEDFL